MRPQLWLVVLAVPLCLGCPPDGPKVNYPRKDADRIIRAFLAKQEPTLQIQGGRVTGLTRHCPGVEPGRAVYFCALFGVRVQGRVRESYTTPWVVDAMTGEVFEPGRPGEVLPARRKGHDNR